MKTLIPILCLFFATNLHAGIERLTVYFEQQSIRMTDESLNLATEMKYAFKNKTIQFIEVNAYVEPGHMSGVQALMENRIDYLFRLLEKEEQQCAIHYYGTQRVAVNFTPESWERIDVYYFEEAASLAQVESEKRPVPASTLSNPQTNFVSVETTESRIPDYFTLPIQFEGGTARVLPNSEKYLEDLLGLMENNTHLTAHIRGHVCCGNKKSISRRRARAVYHYLVGHGISRDRLSYKGYGNTIPLAFPEVTSRDRSTNRRVDVMFHDPDADMNMSEIR